MTRWPLAMTIVATTLLGGCQADPSILSNLLIQPTPAAQLDYAIGWQIDLGSPSGSRIVFAEVLDDRLVTLESGNMLSVIDVADGKVLWRDQVGRRNDRLSKPVRDENLLVVCTETRAFLYDIRTGELRRIVPLKHVATSTPVLADGQMINASARGVIFSQDLRLGLDRWSYQVGNGIATGPILAGNMVFVTDISGRLSAFNPRTGNFVWSVNAYERISAEPVASDRLIYAASHDQSVYAFFLANGRQRWRYFATSPLTESPFLAGAVLLQPLPRNGIIALDAGTGEVLWERPDLNGVNIVQTRNNVIYIHQRRHLLEIDPRNGETLRTTELPGVDYVLAAQPNRGGDLYLIQFNGRMLKLVPR